MKLAVEYRLHVCGGWYLKIILQIGFIKFKRNIAILYKSELKWEEDNLWKNKKEKEKIQ